MWFFFFKSCLNNLLTENTNFRILQGKHPSNRRKCWAFENEDFDDNIRQMILDRHPPYWSHFEMSTTNELFLENNSIEIVWVFGDSSFT